MTMRCARNQFSRCRLRYLRLVLENIAEYRISHITDLLPWNLAAKLEPISW
jgi:hypothetical protein